MGQVPLAPLKLKAPVKSHIPLAYLPHDQDSLDT